jgi:hypothetical protein
LIVALARSRNTSWLSAKPERSVRRPLGHSFPCPLVGRLDKSSGRAEPVNLTASHLPLSTIKACAPLRDPKKKNMKFAAVLFAFCLCFVAVTLATDNLQERTGYFDRTPNHTPSTPKLTLRYAPPHAGPPLCLLPWWARLPKWPPCALIYIFISFRQ